MSRKRIGQVAAVVLGLLLLAMGVLGVVLDSVTHYPGSGGPLVDSLATASAALPAAAVATVLAARRPRNPIGWLLFATLFVGASPTRWSPRCWWACTPGWCFWPRTSCRTSRRRRWRFNRSRYDAEALVAVFTGRLRHTVDFDAVRDDLASVVDQAFQPTQVSMWLAPLGREAVSGKIVS